MKHCVGLELSSLKGAAKGELSSAYVLLTMKNSTQPNGPGVMFIQFPWSDAIITLTNNRNIIFSYQYRPTLLQVNRWLLPGSLFQEYVNRKVFVMMCVKYISGTYLIIASPGNRFNTGSNVFYMFS